MIAERYQQLLALISNEGADMYDRVDAVESAVREYPTVGQRLALLRACLASSDVCIRQVGVSALGADDSPQVTEVLRELLQDPAEPVQEAALDYLAAQGAWRL
jgi:HEAT repeat protein